MKDMHGPETVLANLCFPKHITFISTPCNLYIWPKKCICWAYNWFILISILSLGPNLIHNKSNFHMVSFVACVFQYWPQTWELYFYILYHHTIINVSQSSNTCNISELNFIQKQKMRKYFVLSQNLSFWNWFSHLHSDVGWCNLSSNNSKPQWNKKNCNALSIS